MKKLAVIDEKLITRPCVCQIFLPTCLGTVSEISISARSKRFQNISEANSNKALAWLFERESQWKFKSNANYS